MGLFRVEIEAVGNHGCQRDVKDGGHLAESCGNLDCTDCQVRSFFKVFSGSEKKGTITHWPQGPKTIVDDLVTGERTGSF